MDDTQRYLVTERKQETYDTATLSLACTDGSIPTFVPGQYITVYFPEFNTPEGKAYSISSAPHEQRLSITIKAIGEFSNRLCALASGDVLVGSLPYGFFYSDQKDTDLTLVAGGIGVTPFRSMVFNTRQLTPNRKLSLLHSIRSERDRLFKEDMADANVRYFVTREKAPWATPRRIAVDDILEVTTDRSEVFICGSIPFVRDLWRGLKERGVSEERLYTEAFFSH